MAGTTEDAAGRHAGSYSVILTEFRFIDLGNGATHSELGPRTSINIQDSHPGMPTGQPDVRNRSSETPFPDDSRECQVSVKANQGTETSLGF